MLRGSKLCPGEQIRRDSKGGFNRFCQFCPGGTIQLTADEALLARCRRGEPEAIEELVLSQQKKVYNLAYRLLGNQEDAADAVQEAFLRAFRALPRFRGESSFSTWLYRVTTNVCYDFLRRRREGIVSLQQMPAGFNALLEVGDPSPGPEERAERKEIQEAVQAAIDQLPLEYRLAVILRDIQGLSYEEMASVLGWPPGTVRSRLHRARLALRDVFLESELLAPPDVQRIERRVGR